MSATAFSRIGIHLLSTGRSLRVPLAEILTDSGLSAASGGNALEQAEREQIVRALRESNWVVGGARGAAARLGLKRTSLAYKMDRLGISRPPAGRGHPGLIRRAEL